MPHTWRFWHNPTRKISWPQRPCDGIWSSSPVPRKLAIEYFKDSTAVMKEVVLSFVFFQLWKGKFIQNINIGGRWGPVIWPLWSHQIWHATTFSYGAMSRGQLVRIQIVGQCSSWNSDFRGAKACVDWSKLMARLRSPHKGSTYGNFTGQILS